MNSSLFSSLIYRIIGKPDRWHEDYLDVMNQIMDETDSFEDGEAFDELAIGQNILSKIKQGNDAVNAFNTLLDTSRFKMIILDDELKPIYHNHIADQLFDYVLCPTDNQHLRPALIKLIQTTPAAHPSSEKNELIALDFYDQDNEQIYLRLIRSQVDENLQPMTFYILMVLDKTGKQRQLNNDLVAKYDLTEKEQNVILHLINGLAIKEIATDCFVSENTVKSHLKSVFRKTNCNTQSAVISLILTHESQVLDSYFEADMSVVQALEINLNDRELFLSNGEKIAYCDFGPVDGRPLVVLHSGFGCRFSVPPNYEEVCKRLNRRIIIPDRPGFGNTPFIKNHPEGWNRRFQEFIDLMEINDYDLLGSVFSCKMAIDFATGTDARLQKVILTSPVLVNERKNTDHLIGISFAAARLVRASPRFAREIYELWLKSATLNLGKHYHSMLNTSTGSREKEQFENDGTIQVLIDAFKTAASQSLDGIPNEMVYALTPLGIDLSNFTTPVEF